MFSSFKTIYKKYFFIVFISFCNALVLSRYVRIEAKHNHQMAQCEGQLLSRRYSKSLKQCKNRFYTQFFPGKRFLSYVNQIEYELYQMTVWVTFLNLTFTLLFFKGLYALLIQHCYVLFLLAITTISSSFLIGFQELGYSVHCHSYIHYPTYIYCLPPFRFRCLV